MRNPFPRLADLCCSPLFLALVVTLANAAKPVLVDDTAYLTFARHIAANPSDPYGFEMFWGAVPQPAMTVLAPPVLLYWLAAGIRLFGEHPPLLKLWLFPFVWVLAWAVRDLLRRFARGTESRLLPLIMLSPAVLPTVNLMLDIPALALGLAAVAVFVRAADCGSWRLAVAAGLLAGLAMQTKYTALLVPPAIGWYGLTHRRPWLAALAVFVALALFAGWEGLLVAKYGRSHFLYHVTDQQPRQDAGESALAVFFRQKSELVAPLLGYVGCLGIGVALVAASAMGLPRQLLAGAAGVWALGFLLIVLLPCRMTVLVAGKMPNTGDITTVTVFWQSYGLLLLLGLTLSARLLLFRIRKGLGIRLSRDGLFLIGWVLLELGGYFALTPFGAARRVLGLVVVGGLLAGRVLSRIERIRPTRRLPGWVIGFSVTAGFAVAVLDTFDAFPEKVCAERAAIVAADHPPGATTWYAGHWGFQFYCERAGMRPVVPRESVLMPGDMLVLPLYPDAHGFFRPHAGSEPIPPPSWVAEPIAEVVWDDVISGQTIPNFYGGVYPVVGRDYPRLRVVVYRIRERWTVPDQ